MKKIFLILMVALISVSASASGSPKSTTFEIPANLSVMQTITFNDNTTIKVYYVKENDVVTAYSEDLKGKTIDSVIGTKKTSAEIVKSVPKTAKKVCSYKISTIISWLLEHFKF